MTSSSAETPSPKAAKPKKSPIQLKIEELWEYFQQEFPNDPAAAFGKFFAKKSHNACYGRGLLTVINFEDRKKGQLQLCECARKRRDKFAERLLAYEKTYENLVKKHEDGKEFELPVNQEARAARERQKAETAAAMKEGQAAALAAAQETDDPAL